MDELVEFPFALGPRGSVLCEHYHQRLREDPLGEVRMPSGDVARLAVRHADSAMAMSDPRFTKDLSYEGAPKMYPGINIVADPDVISNMDPARHTRMRKLLAGLFTPARIAGWRPKVRAMANELYDSLPGPQIEYVNQVALPFTIRVICEVFGVPDLDQKRVQDWAEALMPSGHHDLEQQLITFQEVSTYLLGLIDEIRGTGREGILDTMIRARDEQGALSEDELVKNTIALIAAGHESTAATLARGMVRLLDPRAHYEYLVANPHLVANTIDEILRVEVPGDGASIRVALEDIELPSGLVRKGEAVIPSFVGPNNDPTANEAPDEIRLDREKINHLTFGWGAHYCLGANLARMEMQEILSVTIERFPNLALAEDLDGVEWTTMAIKRPVSLLLNLNTEN